MINITPAKAKSILKQWNFASSIIKKAIKTDDFVFISHKLNKIDHFSIFKNRHMDVGDAGSGEDIYDYAQDISDLNIPIEEPEIDFGRDITITPDNKFLLVGAPKATSFIETDCDRIPENNGAVFVFKLQEDGRWEYYTKIVYNESPRDVSGFGKKINSYIKDDNFTLDIKGDNDTNKTYMSSNGSSEYLFLSFKIQERIVSAADESIFINKDFAFKKEGEEIIFSISENDRFFLYIDKKYNGGITKSATVYLFDLTDDLSQNLTYDQFQFEENSEMGKILDTHVSNNGKYFYCYYKYDEAFRISVFSITNGMCKKVLSIKEDLYDAGIDENFIDSVYFEDNALVIENWKDETFTLDIESWKTKNRSLETYTIEQVNTILKKKAKMTEEELYKAMEIKKSKDQRSRSDAIKKGLASAKEIKNQFKTIKSSNEKMRLFEEGISSYEDFKEAYENTKDEVKASKPVLKKIDTRTLFVDPRPAKSSNFKDACIRSSSDIIYTQLFEIVCKEYSEYRDLFANPIMRGVLFNLFSVSLQQISDIWEIDNNTFQAIIHQTKIQGISGIMSGGLDFGESFIKQITTQIKSHLNLEHILKVKQNVGTR